MGKVLLCYVSEDDRENQISTFFMILSKLLLYELRNLTIVILYSSYKYYGSYYIVLKPRKPIQMKRLNDDIDLSKPSTLIDFVNSEKAKYKTVPSKGENEKFSLIISSHCNKWFILPKGKKYIPINDISDEIGKLELLILDCCYTSNIEIAYQFRNTAKYLITNQMYSPDIGFLSYKMIECLDRETDLLKISKCIADEFIKVNSKFPDKKRRDNIENIRKSKNEFLKMYIHPVDVSVLDLSNIEELVRFTTIALEEIDISKIKNKYKLVQDDEWYFNYDLYSTIKNNTDEIRDFKILFNNVVVYYKQNKYAGYKGKFKYYYGLSFYPYLIKGFKNSFLKLDINHEKCCRVEKKLKIYDPDEPDKTGYFDSFPRKSNYRK